MHQTFDTKTMHGSVVELHSWHLKAAIVHTVLSRQFRDSLLSSATVLSMSLFTIITIVSIVTTVNDRIATEDAVTEWTASPVVSIEEGLVASAERTWGTQLPGQVPYASDWLMAHEGQAAQATFARSAE